MPQISRGYLKPAVERRIRELLLDCVKRCQNQQATANFIDVLLTKTEKLMIAKRIAIALMFLKGYEISEITDTLKVTKTTVYTVASWLDHKGAEYVKMLSTIASEDEEKKKKFIDLEREALEYQPRYGTNWKAARRRKWQEAKKYQPPPF